MSKDIHGLSNLINEAVVEVVRRKFLSEADNNPHLYHPIDVKRCQSEDWQIERFIIDKGKPDEALKALITAMQWKKSYGIHDRDHKYFPKEFYLVFGYQKPSVDREGRVCRWGHQNVYRKINDFDQLAKQFVAYNTELGDRWAGNKGLVSVSNAKDAAFANGDISLAKFCIDLLNYYPGILKMGINVDLPWYLSSAWKVMRAFLPKSLRNQAIVIKREELTQYVDIEEIPVSLGGKREDIYDMLDDMLPLSELKHLGFTDKQIELFYETYNFENNNH